MAVSTVLLHEVWFCVDLADNVRFRPGNNNATATSSMHVFDYRQLPLPGKTLFGHAPKQLRFNVFWEYLDTWPGLLLLLLCINLLATGAYLFGWLAHSRKDIPHSRAVREGMYCHLLFRFFAFWGILLPYCAEAVQLQFSVVAAALGAITVAFWGAVFFVWTCVVERRVLRTGRIGGLYGACREVKLRGGSDRGGASLKTVFKDGAMADPESRCRSGAGNAVISGNYSEAFLNQV